MDDSFALNQANWNERAALHAASPDYQVQLFIASPTHLSEVVRFDLPRLGDIRGLRAVHLQCHIGTDTLSLARLGAQISGLDFSTASLEQARMLANACGEHITFVEAEGSLDLWKIAIKPGKPLAFGTVRKADGNAWFIGLPGNPVAAFVTCLMMVRPFVMRLQGIARVAPRILNLPCASAWNKPDGARLEFLRGRINDAGAIELYDNQGSAVATSLCWSDGLILNPPGNCIVAGDTVRFISFAELQA